VRSRQQSQVLVLFALLLPMLLGGVGLAIEGAYALAQRQRMQAAADLAALNAANCKLYPSKPLCVSAAGFPGAAGSPMRGMALSVANANGFDPSTVTLVNPYSGDANRIAVTVAQPVPTTFLAVVGFSQFNVAGRAVGGVQSGPISTSLLALDPSQCGAIALSGNGTIAAASGGIQDNSNCTTALTGSGNSSIDVVASTINVVGGYAVSGNARLLPTPNTGVAALADPLAAVSPPDGSGLTSQGAFSCSGNSTATLSPGIYSSITASAGCAVTLQPGTYVLKGGGMSVSGGANVSGSGVFIYNAGSSFPYTGGSFGSISLSGTGSFNLTPQTSGPYAGILIFQSRDNARTLTITGSGALSGVQGTVYGPLAPVSITGNGTLPAQFIVDSVSISGNGSLTIQYSADQVYSVSSSSLLE
jgi:hypothetical protein